MKKIVFISFLFLAGCFGGSDVADLEEFVGETTAKPRGRIRALPEFKPYSAFVYGASAMRSPFESPVTFEELSSRFVTTVDAPERSRRKEPLERYALGELSLVGTLSKSEADSLKALIRTNGGNVHVVKVGQYMGKNHGRIIEISETQLSLIEVVPSGSGGWISRPHSMGLNQSAGGDK